MTDVEKDEIKEDRTILVKNVDVSVIDNPNQLIEFLGLKKSEVESYRFRCVPILPKYRKISLVAIKKHKYVPNAPCHMYIIVKDPSLVNVALQKNACLFENRHIFVEQPSKSKKTIPFDRVRTVFIARLPASWNEEHIYELCSQVGTITNLRLVRHSITHLSNKFGYVEFNTKAAAALAIKQLDKSELKSGHNLRVQKCLKLPLMLNALGCVYSADFSFNDEFTLLENRFRSPDKVMELLQAGVSHVSERDLLATYPSLVDLIQQRIFQKRVPSAFLNYTPLISDGLPRYELIKCLVKAFQNTDEFATLAVTRILKELAYVITLDELQVILLELTAFLKSDNYLQKPIDKAILCLFAMYYTKYPLTPNMETFATVEIMIETLELESAPADEEEELVQLQNLWNLGSEMCLSNESETGDLRSLFLLYCFLRKCDKSEACAHVLADGLFPQSSAPLFNEEQVTRVVLTMKRFLSHAADELISRIRTQFGDGSTILEIFREIEPQQVEDEIKDQELERINEQRVKRSLYDPVFSDEEVLRVQEIQKFLEATRRNSNEIPRKGYLLACYRFCLAQVLDWKSAVELVQRDPESFQAKLPGIFKNLPYWTTPNKLMELMLKKKAQKAATKADESYNDVLDPKTRNVVSKTLKLAKMQAGSAVQVDEVMTWGTQAEVDKLLKEQEEKALEDEMIQQARVANEERNATKRAGLKPGKQTQSSEEDEPKPAAERSWGPDKMKGGRIPQQKSGPTKRTKTFDKHHAKDRRAAKG